MKLNSSFVIAGSLLIMIILSASCKKCKECASTVVYEYEQSLGFDNDTVNTAYGKTCGGNLKAIEGETFVEDDTINGVQVRTTTTYNCR